jgi:hypothetical protein
MTRTDILTCVHEPFGDAFYFGPERLSARYESDENARESSGFAESTFKSIFERIERQSQEVRAQLLLPFSSMLQISSQITSQALGEVSCCHEWPFSPEVLYLVSRSLR